MAGGDLSGVDLSGVILNPYLLPQNQKSAFDDFKELTIKKLEDKNKLLIRIVEENMIKHSLRVAHLEDEISHFRVQRVVLQTKCENLQKIIDASQEKKCCIS